MHLALVGCHKVGTWPVDATLDDPRPWERDDRPLHDALRARGITFERPEWDDPSVDWARFDGALLRATWDYHHRPQAFLAWIARVEPLTRLLNPAPILRWNVDKTYLRDLDVPQLATRWLAQGATPDLRALTEGWDRAFFKPTIGATAEGTLRFGTSDEELAHAAAHVAIWLERSGGLLQPYVSSVESAGERSAVVIEGKITHWVRKDPVPGDYRVQDDYGATDAPLEPSEAERWLVERVVAALPDGTCYARVDWLLGPDGPALIELELVEPCLFFRHGPGAAAALADAVVRRLRA